MKNWDTGWLYATAGWFQAAIQTHSWDSLWFLAVAVCCLISASQHKHEKGDAL